MFDGIGDMLGRGPKTLEQLEARALERWVRHDNAGAIRDLDRAIALDPSRPEPHVLRGHAFADMERFDDALAAYDDALRVDPRHADAYCGRAVTRSMQGSADEAIIEASKAIEIDPDHFNARATRANSYLERDANELALADAEVVIRVQPTSQRGWWFRGHARLRLGDFDGAIADLDRAVELIDSGRALEPRKQILVTILARRAEAFYNRSVANFEKGQLDDSGEDLFRSASDGVRMSQLAPDHPGGYLYAGRAFARLTGAEPRGKTYLEEARRRTTDPEMLATIDDDLHGISVGWNL